MNQQIQTIHAARRSQIKNLAQFRGTLNREHQTRVAELFHTPADEQDDTHLHEIAKLAATYSHLAGGV